MFHRPYFDDVLVLPELHKPFFSPVHVQTQRAIHPVTSGRRRERKYP
jgi:hypothetical protein